jgi:GNAT superfamily N-acetyltransferase
VTIALRPAQSGDYEFARRTYYQTMRWIIERLFGWDQARQDSSFADQFKLEEVRIILVDGREAGWIQTQVDEANVTLGQFYVVPELQRRGIGSRILATVIDEARSKEKSVIVPVVKFNPAKRLYDRHGFHVTHEDEYKYYMRLD